MDYYVYEYEILTELNKQLNIQSININSETYYIRHTVHNESGKLEDKIVSRQMVDESIELNFCQGFRHEFKMKDLQTYFANGWPKEYVVQILICDIQDKFIKEMLFRKDAVLVE